MVSKLTNLGVFVEEQEYNEKAIEYKNTDAREVLRVL